MNVTLTPELERFVKDQVDVGRFPTASDVVREALRLLLERQRLVEQIDRKVDQAFEDVAAGRTFEPHEARAQLRARRGARNSSPT